MTNPTEYVYRCFLISVVVFGIIGNIFVIVSIFKQKRLLKNNYYFLVSHLALCDFGYLVVNFVWAINLYIVEKRYKPIVYYCLVIDLEYAFQVTGVYMMLIISVLRYRAAVHPLNHDTSRRKWKVVCGLGYVVGLIVGYGTGVPECFVQQDNITYWKFRYSLALVFYSAPPLSIAVLYYKVYRALNRQDKYLKSLGCSQMSQSSSSSSFNIHSYIRSRRTFFICLATVLCYGVGNIPTFVHRLLKITKDNWVVHFVEVLRVAGSNSVNPVIYGILDKKLLIWKLCRERKRQTVES